MKKVSFGLGQPPSYEDLPKPPLTWHRVFLPSNVGAFQYRTKAGDMQVAKPGETVLLDSDVLCVALRRGAVIVPE